MIFVFYFLAAILVLLSFKSFRGGIEYLRFFQNELSKPNSDFTPFATVIAPCRGLDDGLQENLLALTVQNFPAYEIIFVVDDKDDPAVEVIKEFTAGSSEGRESLTCRLVIAQKASNAGQKVENLREAVLHANERSEVFVFVDSDARPSANWLRRIVAPLENTDVGATTGYRWFISAHPTFASELRSAWNASIASALGPNLSSNFCWGGSMAIRRDVFDRIEMGEKWKGTLSDDFAVTRSMKKAGLPIVFVPQALTASVEDCTVAEMLEFTTRQMKITRVYASDLWLLSFVGSGLFNLVLVVAFLTATLSRKNDLAVFVSAITIAAVSIFSAGKAWLRLKAVKLALPEYKKELKSQTWPQITLWLLTPALFFVNSVSALFSRKMTWRGIRYELKSPSETVIIAD